MTALPTWRVLLWALLLPALLVLGAGGAWAQTEDSDTGEDADSQEAIEEIVVVGGRSGDRRSLDDIYTDELRERILNEIEQMREVEEEIAWRSESTAIKTSPESRMSWGYDPRDELLMRNEMDLASLPSDTVRPASVIRIGF